MCFCWLNDGHQHSKICIVKQSSYEHHQGLLPELKRFLPACHPWVMVLTRFQFDTFGLQLFAIVQTNFSGIGPKSIGQKRSKVRCNVRHTHTKKKNIKIVEGCGGNVSYTLFSDGLGSPSSPISRCKVTP